MSYPKNDMVIPDKLYHDTSRGAFGDVRAVGPGDYAIFQVQPQGGRGCDRAAANQFRQDLAAEVVRRWNLVSDMAKQSAETSPSRFEAGDLVRFSYQNNPMEGVVVRNMPWGKLDIFSDGFDYYIESSQVEMVLPVRSKPV